MLSLSNSNQPWQLKFGVNSSNGAPLFWAHQLPIKKVSKQLTSHDLTVQTWGRIVI
jgi:hypothetical protein